MTHPFLALSTRFALAVLFLGAMLGAPGLWAEDWPAFRGPTGQGLIADAGLPLTWDATTNVAWNKPVDGIAWSSPVVSAGRIFLTSAVESPEGQFSLIALALSLDTGEELWRTSLFEHDKEVQVHQKNSHASPTAIVEGDQLYVHFGPHGTACLTTAGAVVWKKTLPYQPQHGNGGSPALHQDRLLLCCDGTDQQYVVALDKKTGDELWKTPRDTTPDRGFSFSTPLLIEVDGTWQAVCPGSNAVFAYDPQTGAEIWRVLYGDGYSVVPRPVFAGGLVFVCTGYNSPKLLAIDPRGKGDITATHLRWELDKAVPHNPSPIAVGENLFFVSDGGVATCVAAATGMVRWQERLGGKFSASPVATKESVYFQDEAGTTYVIAAAAEFKELAKNVWAAEQRTYASFAAANGSLLLRTESHLLKVQSPATSR